MAIVRVSEKAGDDKILEKPAPPVRTGQRDFEAETRGKVACACYTAAVASQGVSMYATSKSDYKEFIEEIAEWMITKVFEHQRG
jgi:hypothetical protein